MSDAPQEPRRGAAEWRHHLHEVIFEAETPAGKAFDVALLVAIVLSVLAVMLESVPTIERRHHGFLVSAEWFFTALFSIEYVLRLLTVRKPLAYARSFYGIVDLLAIVPTYLSVLLPGAQSLAVVRALRLLRVFRVLKLAHLLREAAALRRALYLSRGKIAVFLSTVLITVTIIGSAMYLVEGAESGFTSIPQSVYWCIVTMTTVGYGDVAPQTALGKTLAALMMVLGYSLIVVPTGIVGASLARRHGVSTEACESCSREGHDTDAVHCKYCGARL